MKCFYEAGKLDKKWKACVRYQMEERGDPHPDNMLPNGQIDETLSSQ